MLTRREMLQSILALGLGDIKEPFWQKVYDAGFKGSFNTVSYGSRTGYLAAGSLNFPVGGRYLDQGYIYKVDDDGNILWISSIRGVVNISIEAIICEWGDKFVAAGNRSLDDNIYSYMVKGDKKGFIWTREFPDKNLALYDFEEASPGYLAAGEIENQGRKRGVIIKVSEHGKEIWRRHVDQVSKVSSLRSVSNKGFIGTGNDPRTSQIALIRLGNDGGVLWEKTYSEKGKAKDVVKDYKSFVTLSNAEDYSTIIKTDENGKEVWRKQLPQEITSIKRTRGGYFIVGNLKGDVVTAHIGNDGTTSYSNVIRDGNLTVNEFVHASSAYLIAGSRNNRPYLARISLVGKTGSLEVVK